MYNMFFSVILFLILPKGSVKDEATFFIMLSILIVLIAIALILRRRRLNEDVYDR
jgi:hypothetical protein